MANSRYTFDTDSAFAPHVSAGIGWSRLDIGDKFDTSFTTLALDIETDGGFTFQVGAGLTYKLNERADIIAEYRYFSIPNVEIRWNTVCYVTVYDVCNIYSVADETFNYSTHGTTVGMRISF